MGGMQAGGGTDRPDFLISRRVFHFPVQEHLDRALHVPAVLTALVLDIPLHTRFLEKNGKRLPVFANGQEPVPDDLQ